MSQADTVSTSLTHSSLICSGKAVELPDRATIQYNVYVFSTENVIFCTYLFVGGAGALTVVEGDAFISLLTLLIKPTHYIKLT